MEKKSTSRYSILIVSNSEQFNMLAQKSMPSGRFDVIEKRKSASAARREILVREYDIVLINAPLSDGFGVDFVMDVVDRHSSGIIMAVPVEVYPDMAARLTDYGVIVIPKPLQKGTLDRSLRLLIAFGDRLRKSQKKVRTLEEKMNELKLISRAKIVLVQRGMSEEEAHEYIIREAMNNGLTKREVAEDILE